MRQMEIQEFARRLKKFFDSSDSRMTLFLGAGCSISSGIPSAGELVRQWLPRLKKIRTGSEQGTLDWVKKIYPDYNPANAAQFYGAVIEELFLTPEERQKEIERLMEGKDPAFGYAVLAQLIGHKNYGRHCNIVLTTNFDDMVADALYLYTQQKPLLISHESLLGFIRITRTRPLVIKLHGDARLEPKNTEIETKTLSASIKNVLRNILAETGLVFVGYGGNDHSIGEILQELPAESLPLGVYWINDHLPENVIGQWLERRQAVWVRHCDFDELMLLLWSEFALKHPDRQRFDRLLSTYLDTFQKMKHKLLARPESQEKEVLHQAMEKAVDQFTSWWAVEIDAGKYKEQQPEKAEEIYRQGLQEFPNEADLLTSYANFLTKYRQDHDRADEYYRKALALKSSAFSCGNYALFLYENGRDSQAAGEYFRQAIEHDPYEVNNLTNYATYLDSVEKDHSQAERYYQRALEIAPDNRHALANYAYLAHFGCHDYEKAEEIYQKLIQRDSDDSYSLGNYAILLAQVRKDYSSAEHCYRRALRLAPNDPHHLCNYAGMLLAIGRNAEGLRLIEQALPIVEAEQDMSNLLECHFYLYAHNSDPQLRLRSLQKIKGLLAAGSRSPDWNFDANIERSGSDNHLQLELLTALAQVITAKLPLEDLQRFPDWKALELLNYS